MKKWLIATRPWSFVMTFISVSLAAALAYRSGVFNLLLYLITLAGLVISHAAGNMINDYFDVKYGVDRPDAPTARYRQHPLFQGGISERSFLRAILALYAIGLLIAGYLTLIRGYLIALFTLAGLFFSIFYTSSPLVFKYRSLGEPTVFIVWGPLMVGGSYFVISGELPPDPILASIPVGILVALVLLANNIRDVEYDGKVGITTIAVKLGRERALKLYEALLALAYISTALLIAIKVLSVWSLMTLLTLPRAINIVKTFRKEVPDAADPITAQLTLNYGALLILGELIGTLLA